MHDLPNCYRGETRKRRRNDINTCINTIASSQTTVLIDADSDQRNGGNQEVEKGAQGVEVLQRGRERERERDRERDR